MMRVCVFASGSGGNCLLVSSGNTNILIDAGISARRILSSLSAQKLSIDQINGVLITHEHSDHVSGLKTLLKYHNVPLYAPRTVAARICGMLPEAADFMRTLPVGEDFYIGEMKIRAFHTPHDTDESVGYRIEADGIFALATDIGHISSDVAEGLLGADTVLIESNHDEQMLSYGSYPVYLKRRILSERGHLSNADCSLFLPELVKAGAGRIILGHLSRENNNPARALYEAEKALKDSAAELFCAPVFGALVVPVGCEETEECLM